MKVVDYARSYLRFRIDTRVQQPTMVSQKPPYSLNNPRIQIESVCWITDARNGATHRFALGASCKTERVGVQQDIWILPSADYVPVVSDDRYVALKTYARQGESIELWPPGSGTQTERQETAIADAFASLRLDLLEVEGEVLPDARSIVEASLGDRRLIARTTISEGPYTAVIEYPIKTMNANERDWIYQTDTGPHLFPDLTREPDRLLTGMELAFSAFNVPGWTEFIVRVPTELAPGLAVWHYAKPVRLEARNEVVALSG